MSQGGGGTAALGCARPGGVGVGAPGLARLRVGGMERCCRLDRGAYHGLEAHVDEAACTAAAGAWWHGHGARAAPGAQQVGKPGKHFQRDRPQAGPHLW